MEQTRKPKNIKLTFLQIIFLVVRNLILFMLMCLGIAVMLTAGFCLLVLTIPIILLLKFVDLICGKQINRKNY